ncbi:MAG: TadE/TadG family type IV pilus assembly protein [Caldilineaceae bacterium]
MKSLLKKLLYRQQGTSLAEFAILLPLLLLMVLGTFDFGNGFNTYLGMTNAAREGAMWLARHPDDLAGMNTRINAEVERVGLTAAQITVVLDPNKTSFAAGDAVTVIIQHPYPLMYGAVTGLPSFTLETEATMRVY